MVAAKRHGEPKKLTEPAETGHHPRPDATLDARDENMNKPLPPRRIVSIVTSRPPMPSSFPTLDTTLGPGVSRFARHLAGPDSGGIPMWLSYIGRVSLRASLAPPSETGLWVACLGEGGSFGSGMANRMCLLIGAHPGSVLGGRRALIRRRICARW